MAEKQNANKGTWGGRRAGSGKKPAQISDAVKRRILRALKKVDKEEGSHWLERLAELTKRDADPKDRIRVSQGFITVLTVHESHREIEKSERAVVELPSIKDKPEEYVRMEAQAKQELTH